MPLIERLLHPMLAGDDGRPAFQSFGVASDVGGRLGSCGGSSTSIVAAAIVNRRRSRTPVGPVSNRICPIGNRTYVFAKHCSRGL
ncbi:MAG: hypothetical protein WC340_09590 [Kiritimatiellia bacterium]